MSPRRQSVTKNKLSKASKCPITKIKEKGFSIWAIKLLTIFSITMLFITAINYLTLLSTQKINARKISALENKYQSLKEDNAQAEILLNTSIDYDEIYKTATEELGMTYPSEEQIIKYQSGESEYVIQFSPIPDK